MMDDALSKRGHSFEEAFFRERDAELIAQRKKLEQMENNKNVLAEVSGIRNSIVLDKLVELEVSPATLASLTILPLVEVAWADGTLDEKEKEAVLAEAAKGGITRDSIDYALLNAWLKERPSPKLLEAWIHYIMGLREVMSPKELGDLKSELLNRAKKVAEAAGGFLSKVSAKEKTVLKKMEEVFK